MTRSHRGFTLTELLITVAIIVLLVSLVIVIFRPVQDAAHQTNSLSALRQIGAAYSTYTNDHRGRFLPGYLEPVDGVDPVETLNVRSRMSMPGWHNGFADNPNQLRSYVWRLAPYIEGHWAMFYEDTPDSSWFQGVSNRFSQDDPADPEQLAMDIAQSPSFGLNSIFVGGDSGHGGSYAIDRNPWTGDEPPLAATRLTQVREPARLLVFGAAGPVNPGSGTPQDTIDDTYLATDRGYAELRAPYIEKLDDGSWENRQWSLGEASVVVREAAGTDDLGAGLPIRRSAEGVPIVMIDGSTEAIRLDTLSEDMSRWSKDGFRPD